MRLSNSDFLFKEVPFPKLMLAHWHEIYVQNKQTTVKNIKEQYLNPFHFYWYMCHLSFSKLMLTGIIQGRCLCNRQMQKKKGISPKSFHSVDMPFIIPKGVAHWNHSREMFMYRINRQLSSFSPLSVMPSINPFQISTMYTKPAYISRLLVPCLL